jgi:netrin-G3 ligand
MAYGFRMVVFTEEFLWSVSRETLPHVTMPLPDSPVAAGSIAGPAAGGAVFLIFLVAFLILRKRKSDEKTKEKEEILMKDLRARRAAKSAEAAAAGPGGVAESNLDEIDLDDFSAYDALEEKAIGDTSQEGSDVGLNIPPVPRLGPVQSCTIPTEELGNVITQMSANSDFAFSEEYECLETGNEFTRLASQLMENKVKNRYANILPYDYTRVRLALQPGDRFSDYINANFMDGYSKKGHYIAAQGPTPHTLPDFWRLLWEHSVQVISMVTNCEEKGRIKCQRYWPTADEDELDLQNGLYVTLVDQQDFPDYIIRTLRCRSASGDSRTLIQYHYTTWPDHGVPSSTAALGGMIRKIRVARGPGGTCDAVKGPMLVHCSAGVGRTGTLIAIDINLDSVADRGSVDPLATLNKMRRQRSTMVQTEEQYIFIYKSLFDAQNNMTEFTPVQLREHVRALRNPNAQGQSILEAEFKKLNAAATAPNARTDSAQMSANRAKNRFQNVLPFESTRVKLIPIPGVVGSDYINANFLDGFKKRGAYIATQGPLEGTMGDFWRMIWEHEIHIVTMLTELSEGGRVKSEHYWPDVDEPPLNCGDYQVTHVSTERVEFGAVRLLQLTNLLSEQSREIMHFQYTAWPAATPSASDARSFFDLRERISAHQDSKIVMPGNSIYGNAEAINEQARLAQVKPVVVHCSAGVGRTGAFVGLMSSLERLIEEATADPFTMVKHMRSQRMSIVQTPDQYEFIYQMLVFYLDKGSLPPPPVARRAPPSAAAVPSPGGGGGGDDGGFSLDSLAAPPPVPTKTIQLAAMAETSFGDDSPAPAPPVREEVNVLLNSMTSFDNDTTATDGYEITYDGDEYGLSI